MRWVTRRRAAFVVAAAALALSAAPARAAEGSDGSYGRLEGDLTLVAGLGGVAAPRGPRAEGELRLRYLESLGVFGSYEDGATFGSRAEPGRIVAVGLEVRPLFMSRWLTGNESEEARFDLVADSLGLELAATWSQPAGEGFASRGGLQLGLGVEMPLLVQATGPWIGVHAGLRWSDAALASGAVQTADDRAAFVSITVAWHQVVVAHVVDVGDEAPR
jgi:hypothetical protein